MRFSIFAISILCCLSCSVDSSDQTLPISKKEAINQEISANDLDRIPTYFTGKQHVLEGAVCGLLPMLTIDVYYFNFQATPSESCTTLFVWWDMGELMPLYNSGNYDIQIDYKYKLLSTNELIYDTIDVDAEFDLYSNPNPFLLRHFDAAEIPRGIKAVVQITNRTTNCTDQFTGIKWLSPCS